MTDIQINSTNSKSSNDEIDLFKLLLLLLKKWKILVLFTLLGLLLAVIFIIFSPKKYTVSANIEIAKVAENYIEPNEMIIERLKSIGFRQQVINNLLKQDIISKNDEIKWFYSLQKMPSLPKSQKLDSLINLSLDSVDPNVTMKLIDNIIITLNNDQKNKFDNHVNQIKLKIDTLQKSLNLLKTTYQQFEKNEESFQHQKNNQFIQYKLSEISQAGTFVNLTENINSLQSSLFPPSTYKARLLSNYIDISPQPVSPKKLLILILGILCSFVIGCIYVLCQKYIQDYRKLY